MSEREMNALSDLLDFAGESVKAMRTKGLNRFAKDLEKAIAEMKAATKEADGD